MHKYKLKDEYLKDGERVIIGVGVTEKGYIQSVTPLESPLLEEVAADAVAPVQAVAPVAPAPEPIQTTQIPVKENE